MPGPDLMAKPIATERALPLIMTKHYAMSRPSISYSFGLFHHKELVGVCAFGVPISRELIRICPWKMLELNRLCIICNIPNSASFLIGKSIKLLSKSSIRSNGVLLVSYADANMNHHGYIYQASNWVYTGETTSENIITINGKRVHRRAINSRYGSSSKKNITKLKNQGLDIHIYQSKAKHRYFYPVGKNKKQRKEMIKWIENRYGINPYPKGKNTNYDIKEIKAKIPKAKTKGFF